VGKVAELYYTTNLNIAHIGLKWMEEGDMDTTPGIQKAIETLKTSREERYWGIPHSWKPTQAQQAKEIFRYAMFLRLLVSPETIPFASAAIGAAARMSPNDAGVMAKKRKIAAWKRRAGPVDQSAFDGMMSGLTMYTVVNKQVDLRLA
jgi:hypothetical protein